jgi:hypothetical protein
VACAGRWGMLFSQLNWAPPGHVTGAVVPERAHVHANTHRNDGRLRRACSGGQYIDVRNQPFSGMSVVCCVSPSISATPGLPTRSPESEVRAGVVFRAPPQHLELAALPYAPMNQLPRSHETSTRTKAFRSCRPQRLPVPR